MRVALQIIYHVCVYINVVRGLKGCFSTYRSTFADLFTMPRLCTISTFVNVLEFFSVLVHIVHTRFGNIVHFPAGSFSIREREGRLH